MGHAQYKRARLLAQYTKKKLLNEEKQMLLEKLSKEYEERKILIAQYNEKSDSSSLDQTLPNKRAEREAQYLEALASINWQPLPLTPVLTEAKASLVEDREYLSNDEDEWSGFLTCNQNQAIPTINENDDCASNATKFDYSNGINPIAGPSKFQMFDRLPHIQSERELLPVLAEEQPIIEMIRYNDISFISGETGSGKTTQLPQLLLESGFALTGKIGITQPRRVAAIAMASRVSLELNLPPSSLVGYQVRYDASISESSAVIFMTEGILLRIISADFLLNDYSVIIIDEAHERTINTDLLLGLLTRIVALRRKRSICEPQKSHPLKLIIMSATLQIKEILENTTSPFFRCFEGKMPPIITIPSRQHPIHIHYSKVTPHDVITEAYKKVIQIHRNLPKGGILVFVTGQEEIWSLIRMFTTDSYEAEESYYQDNEGDEHFSFRNLDDDPSIIYMPSENYSVPIKPRSVTNISSNTKEVVIGLRVLPFYSLLPFVEQEKVLKYIEDSAERLVVVSTNLAETSITIPGISYVIDTGLVKRRVFDEHTGVETYMTGWISKASAKQRAGRAGRTGPGHVYRLYSSPIFEDIFEEFEAPEILRIPTESIPSFTILIGIILTMKAMNIDNIQAFPFPSPPDPLKIEIGERLLILLEALTPAEEGSKVHLNQITDCGRGMSMFPIPVRYAKISFKNLVKEPSVTTQLREFLALYSLNEKPLDEALRLRYQLDSLIRRVFTVNFNDSELHSTLDENTLTVDLSLEMLYIFISAHPDTIAKKISQNGKRLSFIPLKLANSAHLKEKSNWISFITQYDESSKQELIQVAKATCRSIFSSPLAKRTRNQWFVYGKVQQHLSGGRASYSLSILSEIPDPVMVPILAKRTFSTMK